MELVLCTVCKRHVAVTERTCPFCASAVARQRPQFARAASFTRAAIFSAAALASGCESDKPAPPSAPAPAQAGSADDLEKLLDQQPPVANVPAPADAGVLVDAPPLADAAVADAAVDAGVPKKKKKQQVQRVQQTVEEQIRQDQELRMRHMAKPYGAPPARRRIV